MSTVNVNVNIDIDKILESIDRKVIESWLSSKYGVACISQENQRKYVNVDASIKSGSFYDYITDKVMDGTLSLEMIIGKVTTTKLMNEAKERQSEIEKRENSEE